MALRTYHRAVKGHPMSDDKKMDLKVMVRMLTRGNPGVMSAQALRDIEKAKPEWDVDFHVNHIDVAMARNEITCEARRAEVDYCIMIDDDVVPGIALLDMPEKMAKEGIHCMMGMVPTWRNGRFWWNFYQLDDTDHLKRKQRMDIGFNIAVQFRLGATEYESLVISVGLDTARIHIRFSLGTVDR